MNRWKTRLPIVVFVLAGSTFVLSAHAQDFKCADGGKLTVQGGDKNRAFDAVKLEPVKSLHEKITRQSPSWLGKIDGPADENMIYDATGKSPVMVMSWCANHECDTRYAFAVSDNDQYGIDVTDNGKKFTLGTLSQRAISAVTCKRAYIESKKWKR
jgi:hypothetical protein